MTKDVKAREYKERDKRMKDKRERELNMQSEVKFCSLLCTAILSHASETTMQLRQQCMCISHQLKTPITAGAALNV